MNIAEIILKEGRWYDDQPTVTVLHGTSSALIADIKQNGLQAPPQDIEEYARRILHQYIPDNWITPKMWELVYQRAVAPRLDRGYVNGPTASAIYGFFEPHRDRAGQYARSLAEHGGEVAWAVWEVISNLPRWRKTKPRYAGSTPVIIAVEVPKSWVFIHADMKEVADRLKREWADNHKRSILMQSFGSFEEFANDVGEFEVRIVRDVPSDLIRWIEPATAP